MRRYILGILAILLGIYLFFGFYLMWAFCLVHSTSSYSPLEHFVMQAVPSLILCAIALAVSIKLKRWAKARGESFIPARYSAHTTAHMPVHTTAHASVPTALEASTPKKSPIPALITLCLAFLLVENYYFIQAVISGEAVAQSYELGSKQILLTQIFAALAIVLPQILGEELLFRWILFGSLHRLYNHRLSNSLVSEAHYHDAPYSYVRAFWVVGFSSIAFTLIHFPQTWTMASEYFVASLLLGCLAYMRGDIILSSAFHFLNNAFNLFVFNPFNDTQWTLYPAYLIERNHNAQSLIQVLIIASVVLAASFIAHRLTPYKIDRDA